ncbi:MAG: signal transduction protein GarA [uncultured bacterium]|nr:MAG: signal transduction protein GarA [uncultured bacterium]
MSNNQSDDSENKSKEEEKTFNAQSANESDADKTIQAAAPQNLSDEEATVLGSMEETKMGDSPDMEMLALGAKFEVISKEDHGSEFFITSPTMTAGRSEDSGLKLNFQGVSRNHFIIKYENKNFYIEDSGSKYGTLVGKKKISSPTVLKNGDIVQVGELTLKFNISSKTQGISSGKLLAIAGVFIVIIAGLIVFKNAQKATPLQVPNTSQTAQLKEVSTLENKKLVNDILFQAQNLAAKGKLEEAIEKIQEAAQIAPENAEVNTLLKSWQSKSIQKSKIDYISQLIDIGSFEQAKTLINDLLITDPNNIEAKTLNLKIEKLSSSQESLQKLSLAKDYLKNGQIQKSKSVLDEINDPDVKKEVDDLRNKILNTEKVDKALSEISELYNKGDFSNALNKINETIVLDADVSKLSQLKANIEKYNNLSNNVDIYISKNQSIDAMTNINDIITLLGPNHPLSIKAKEQFNKLKSANVITEQIEYQKMLKSMCDGNLKETMNQLENLVKNFPDNKYFSVLQDEYKLIIDNLAKTMYRAGYVVEEANPIKAQNIWQRLKQNIPENHPYANKLKTKIR